MNRFAKSCICALMLLCILSGMLGCTSNQVDVKSIETENGYIRMDFAESNGSTLKGLGTELDPHLLRSINTQYGVTEKDWELVCQRVEAMHLQKIRVMVMPEWFEPQNENSDPYDMDMDAFSWDNEDMASLYKVLDLAEKNGIRVNLTLWGAHASQNSWLAVPGTKHWISPPNNLDEWSENFCALLKYLVEVKGYTCIEEIIPFNEANPAYYVKDPSEVNIEDYAKMIINLAERMQTEGIRDYANLVVGDDGGVPSWVLENVQHPQISQVADGYSTHVCLSMYYNLREITDYAKMLVDTVKEQSDKPLFISEFGASFRFDDATWEEDLDSFERGLTIGKMMTVFFGVGASGMEHWCLFDQYYGENAPMYRGLWAFKDRDWKIYPVYYALSAVTQHTQIGSVLYAGQTRDTEIAGTALQGDNGWAYLLVNETMLPQKVAIVNSNVSEQTMNSYVYSESTIPADGSLALPSSGTVTMKDHVIYYEIPANSFVVLSEN